jgi:hypothetical protein
MRGYLAFLAILSLGVGCGSKKPVSEAPAAAPASAPAPAPVASAPAPTTPIEPPPAPAPVATAAGGPVVAPPKVSDADCKKACANALTLLKATFPEGVSADMRATIEGKLATECPRDCMERADQESVDCIILARTSAELSACPK